VRLTGKSPPDRPRFVHVKSAVKNALLLLVSVALAVGVAELFARLVLRPPPIVDVAAMQQGLQKILLFDDRLASRYRPNSRAVIRSQYGEFEVVYQMNELGLRDRSSAGDVRRGSLRVLALGNSLPEGWGVNIENGFLREAEQRAARNGAGQGITIVNAGISGYGAAQCYLFYEELREKVAPAAVVFFYVATMVHLDHKYLSDAELDGSGLAAGLSVEAMLKGGKSGAGEESGAKTISPTLRALAEHSALVRRVVRSMLATAELQRVTAGDPASDLLAGTRGDPGRMETLHEPSLRHVAAIAKAARRVGIPFLLVHLPLPHQLSAHEWTKGRTAYGLESREYPAPDRDIVAAFCRRENISCVAAHDALRAVVAHSSAGPRLFYDYDFHPNEAGNAALGAWLAKQLAGVIVQR
jgi:lysophospholipase L1-like esterase